MSKRVDESRNDNHNNKNITHAYNIIDIILPKS